MSVLYSCEEGYFLSHEDFVNNIYKDVLGPNQEKLHYKIVSKLFAAKKSYCEKKSQSNQYKNKRRKRKFDYSTEETEIAHIKNACVNCIVKMPAEVRACFDAKLEHNDAPNCLLTYTNEVTKVCSGLTKKVYNGGNTEPFAILTKVFDADVLIPPMCRFFSGPISSEFSKIENEKFDLVIADPPWWNKYIRRLKQYDTGMGYSMMYNEQIAAIPIENVLAENALVALWCTNSNRNLKSIQELILPAWGLEYVATWHWIKVANNLDTICAFGQLTDKQPYENIILAKKGLLSQFLPVENPRVLEIFARYLLPNTTSIGMEPLRWQYTDVYSKIMTQKETLSEP